MYWVTLPIKLPRTGEFTPGLEMFGNRTVEQRALGVARVVELGFCTGQPARMRMLLARPPSPVSRGPHHGVVTSRRTGDESWMRADRAASFTCSWAASGRRERGILVVCVYV